MIRLYQASEGLVGKRTSSRARSPEGNASLTIPPRDEVVSSYSAESKQPNVGSDNAGSPSASNRILSLYFCTRQLASWVGKGPEDDPERLVARGFSAENLDSTARELSKKRSVSVFPEHDPNTFCGTCAHVYVCTPRLC